MNESRMVLQQVMVQNNFFGDFLLFLRTLQRRPLLLTQTGNLRRAEIDYFGKEFAIDIYQRDKAGEIIFQLRTEDEVPHLQRIRLIARVMDLVYKRKGKLFLSS